MYRRQYIPDSEDLKNKALTKLAINLKEKSVTHTLTKMVDWQERNIPYWMDRANMFILLLIFLVLAVSMLPIPQFVKTIVIIFLAVIGIFDIIYSLIYMVSLITFVIIVLTFIFTVNFNAGSTILPVSHLIMLSIFFGCIISLLFYLIMKYRSLKSMRPGFKLGDTFKLSLSIEKILNYRLAICRDYAKLTAGLLHHMYPKKRIYFVEIRGHVATAIKHDDIYYVLDQRLPVLSLDKWMSFWKVKLERKVLSATILEMQINKKKVRAKKFETKSLKEVAIPDIDTKKIKSDIVKELNLKLVQKQGEPDAEIKIPYFSVRYVEDSLVKHSILKLIRNKIENELCGDLSRLVTVDVDIKEGNLVLQLYLM